MYVSNYPATALLFDPIFQHFQQKMKLWYTFALERDIKGITSSSELFQPEMISRICFIKSKSKGCKS